MNNEKIHDFFGLSYANYLVLSRTLLQSAPDEWQVKFIKLVNELNEMFDNQFTSNNYQVYLRDQKTGRYISDPLSNYERGRRILPIKKDE